MAVEPILPFLVPFVVNNGYDRAYTAALQAIKPETEK